MMISLVSLIRLALPALLLSSGPVRAITADSYITTESPIAKTGLLANIGPSGSKSNGAKSGVVIASPSTSSPDYS